MNDINWIITKEIHLASHLWVVLDMTSSKALFSSIEFRGTLSFPHFLIFFITFETTEHGDVGGSDLNKTHLEPLMFMSSASFPLVLSLEIEELSWAEPISNLRGGDTVVLDPTGPMVRVNARVLPNQYPSLDPLRIFIRVLGFKGYLMHSIPLWDWKREFFF